MLFAGTAGLGLSLGACKRREMPKVELLDEDGTPPETEAISALAPPWPPAERVVLGNGLLVHWLTEEGSPALHVRLLLPTHGLDELARGAAAVVAEAVAIEARRWTQRYGTSVELASRVDRYEIAIHGEGANMDAIISALGRVVSLEEPEGLLVRAQEAVVVGLPDLDAELLALTTLVGILDDRDPARDRLSKETASSLTPKDMLAAWEALVDPKRSMLVVHAGRPVAERSMTRLAKAWSRGGLLSGIGRANDQALERLRPTAEGRAARGKGAERSGSDMRLRGSPKAPIHLMELAPGERGSLLVLGRIMPLPTVEDRARARLAQRVLQEEVDARLTIVGDRGLFVIALEIRRVPRASEDGLGKDSKKKDKDKKDKKDKQDKKDKEAPKDPRAAYIVDVLDETREFLRARAPRLRLAQAAELWLGARMVQASLTGEDWTRLWSESLDLSLSEAEIGGALARDALAMLAIDPEELAEFSRKWLDFDGGEPGWAWVAASSEPDIEKALKQIAKVTPVGGMG